MVKAKVLDNAKIKIEVKVIISIRYYQGNLIFDEHFLYRQHHPRKINQHTALRNL